MESGRGPAFDNITRGGHVSGQNPAPRLPKALRFPSPSSPVKLPLMSNPFSRLQALANKHKELRAEAEMPEPLPEVAEEEGEEEGEEEAESETEEEEEEREEDEARDE